MVAVGDVWESHELLSELDRGMVRTFLARQVGDTTSHVWLHMREGSRTEREVFEEEIERLQQLAADVPNIDPVLYGSVKNSIAWVATRVHSNAIRLKEATQGANLGLTGMKIAIELGGYLVECYEHGWVHGSMSPEHVLISSGGGYLITHFGFVRLFEPRQKEVELEPRYAAPELLQREGSASKQTDVYGLGTILYELICRRELYGGQKNLAFCALTREPDYPAVVPAILRQTIAKALSKNPQNRYPNAEHLLAVLQAHADDWDHLDREPDDLEQPEDTLRSSPAVAEEEPRAAALLSPVPETSPNVLQPTHDGGEASAPVPELGTLDPPSPRVYVAQPIHLAAPSSSEATLPPEAPPSPARQGRDVRPRSSFAALVVALGALVVALGSLALVAAMSLLWSERPARPVARLAPFVQIATARDLRRPLDALPKPATVPPPATPPQFATRRAALARRVAASPPSAEPRSQGVDDYVWKYAIRY